MNAWTASISREEFNLFNPAFVAFTLSEAARGHVEHAARPGPMPLLFSAATIAMFAHLRAGLPSTTRTHVSTWVVDHPDFRPEFQRLAASCALPIRHGLAFALEHSLLRAEASLLTPEGRRPSRPASLTSETKEVLAASRFLGRWFAKAGSPATVLSLLGFSR